MRNRETNKQKKKRKITDELMLTTCTVVQSKSIEQDEASPLFPLTIAPKKKNKKKKICIRQKKKRDNSKIIRSKKKKGG